MIETIKRIAEAGVDLVLEGRPHYTLMLEPAEVVRLLEIGEDAFLREYFDVSPEQWAAFTKHTTDAAPECSAVTRSGHACRGFVERFYGDPRGFVLGKHDRCPVHRERD